MTDTPRPWDRRADESDPAYEAVRRVPRRRLAAGRVPATIRRVMRIASTVAALSLAACGQEPN